MVVGIVLYDLGSPVLWGSVLVGYEPMPLYRAGPGRVVLLHLLSRLTILSIRRVEKGPGHTCAGPVLMPGHQYRLLGRMALWRECDMPYRPVYGGLPSRHLGV